MNNELIHNELIHGTGNQGTGRISDPQPGRIRDPKKAGLVSDPISFKFLHSTNSYAFSVLSQISAFKNSIKHVYVLYGGSTHEINT